MISFIRKITDAVFNIPLLYKGLRILFLGGLPTPPLLRLLDAQKEDVIIDVGCGTGFIAQKTAFKKYIGFDADEKVIEIARNKNIPGATFWVASAENFDFTGIHATKAVLYGILHHLDDDASKQLLRNLSRCVSESIVTLDSVYLNSHPINNLLCRLDRGRHVRTLENWDKLIEGTGLKIETRLLHDCNTKIATYLSYRLVPESQSKIVGAY